ncbi:unnamed protein product [Rotaria magnacalcarata]|uniref:Uncharacterized protein n=2 Tax=Rotaria magnacalcarata TaxID=392030 RepID=A0A816X4M7_9BILA|nr:unnamed protein product [Rotaria magnacalcarata]
MTMTIAERMKKYREKIKKDKVKNEAMKAKARDRKKDTIVVKEDDGSKVTYQKRILFNNLLENYELFKEENKNVWLSRSSFAELRPPFVVPKAALTYRNCLCLYHENVCLLLKSLDKYVDGRLCSSLQMFTDNMAEVTDEKIELQVNFAENFNIKEQDEIQKAHWNSKTLSIFTAYVWSKNEKFSFALPSLDVTHGKFVVDAALEMILNHIVTVLPNIKEVDCFSDGAASQFIQRFHFRNLVQIANERNIHLSWHFFATSHGKGVVDGIGGTVKRLVWSAILAGGVCRSAEDFIKIAKKKTKKVILIEITKNNIDNSKTKLENIFKMAKIIPETLKMHSVKVVDNNTLEFRYYSTCSQKKAVKY